MPDIVEEMWRLSKLLDRGVAALRSSAAEVADAEHAYRRAKALAWVAVLDALPGATVPERTAWVQGATADERRARDLAEASRLAALEAVRSRRQQISALQTLANADRAEAELAKTGPQWDG